MKFELFFYFFMLFCSASGMFADGHVDGFAAIMRKRAASLMRRMRGRENGINIIAGRVQVSSLEPNLT